LDVTDAASIRRVTEEIEQRYGALDILVNNAGIARGDGRGLPAETTVETLRAVYETNVFGVVALINALMPLLLAARRGRSSTSPARSPRSGRSPTRRTRCRRSRPSPTRRPRPR